VQEGWYVTLRDDGDDPVIVGPLYLKRADAETEATRLNKAMERHVGALKDPKARSAMGT